MKLRFALLTLAVTAAACGGGSKGATPSATVPEGPSATNTTAKPPADPYAIPEEIDAAYLNRVFEALDQIDGDATRIILKEKSYGPEASDRLMAIYGQDEFKAQTDLWLDLLRKGPTNFRSPTGNVHTRVSRVILASPVCVWMAVDKVYDEELISPPPPHLTYVALKPRDPSRDPKQLNGTPWMIFQEGYRRDGSEPDNPCA